MTVKTETIKLADSDMLVFRYGHICPQTDSGKNFVTLYAMVRSIFWCLLENGRFGFSDLGQNKKNYLQKFLDYYFYIYEFLDCDFYVDF